MLFICSCDCLNTGGSMKIKIMKNDKLWLEDNAVRQLETIATFDGVLDIVGLPDLHAGKQPVGTTILTKKIIFPMLVGNDIGCGMALYDTETKLKKINVNRIIKYLEGTQIKGTYSIGGGNHFAELTIIDKIFDQESAKILNLNKNNLHLLIHSGSRNIGEKIYRKYASLQGLKEGTESFNNYIDEHNRAIEYAKDNRNNIANIILDMIHQKNKNQLIVDTVHNYIEIVDDQYYHRKGSVSSIENEYSIIAGSRGSYSYLVKTIPNELYLNSISHGSGRKWQRSLCYGRLSSKYKKDELKKTKLGSYVISKDKSLYYEEAPEAYKNINDIIDTLLDYNCIQIIARLKPLMTYKC